VHTAGPWLAARRYVHELAASGHLASVARLGVELYGGAACVGRECGADAAIVAGLEGLDRALCDATAVRRTALACAARRTIHLDGRHEIRFDPAQDIGFRIDRALAYDGGAIRFAAFDAAGASIADRMYLAMGDDVVLARGESPASPGAIRVPYDYAASADALIDACRAAGGRRLGFVALANEGAITPPGEVRARLLAMRDAMQASVDRGLLRTGALPGGRKRTASTLAEALDAGKSTPAQRCRIYAIAAAEENAAGDGVVAAPSSGAAGVVAALLRHALTHDAHDADAAAVDFLATAGATGALLRRAGLRQVGCQGEIGVAAAMAAAGSAAVLGGTPAQALHAAELALEPHLGLACDPVGGHIESPCIERNGLAAARACAAAMTAVREPEPRVALDAVVRSMLETARSLAGRYKEASLGGVAMSVPDC
jgi:L-serine dehydratase